MEIKFINFNGIEQYARVMYNDVKDSDKYKIEVAYSGKDIKALLEYLFKLEEENNKQKEVIDKIKKELEEPDIYGVDEDGYDDAYYDKIYVRRIEELLEEIE